MIKLMSWLKHLYLIIVLLSTIFYASCERVEGCADPLAENYDAEADKSCCCTYYQLYADVNHLADTLSLSYFTPYADANNDTFELQEAAFLCSNFGLITNTGRLGVVRDTIDFRLQNGNSQQFTDDFSVLKPNVFIRNIGDFLDYDSYEKVRFLIGLDENAASVDANQVGNVEHPLSSQNTTNFFNGQSYNTAFFEVIIRPTTDTIRFEIQDTFWMEFNYNVIAQDGRDTPIPLSIDYLRVFDGISFVNDDSITIVQKIKNNIKDGISIQ